jgi:hypothetical protein
MGLGLRACRGAGGVTAAQDSMVQSFNVGFEFGNQLLHGRVNANNLTRVNFYRIWSNGTKNSVGRMAYALDG